MRRAVLVLLFGCLLLAGCSDSGSGSGGSILDAVKGSPSTAVSTTSPAGTGTRAAGIATPQPPGPLEQLLAFLPDTAETRRSVEMADFDRLRRAHGIQPPADPGNQAQKEAYLAALNTALRKGASGVFGGFASGLGPYASTATIERYLGYRRVDQDALAGAPPNTFEVVRGQFDPAAAERAISGCTREDCPIPVTRPQAQGVIYYRWGEDFEQRLRDRLTPPANDQLGRGGRIHVNEQMLLRTLGTPGMEQMLAVWKTGNGSLRQVEEVRLAARGLDRLGAHGGFLTNDTQDKGDGAAEITAAPPDRRAAVEAAWNPPAGAPLLAPYVYVAAGPGWENGTPYTYIILVHADSQAAQENAALLTRRIAETNSARTGKLWKDRVEGVETKVDGRVLEVKLKGATFGPDFLIARDPLLLHR